MIDLHQLRVFTMVAEKKSFSEAAEAMFLTQPTVSSHVKNLEESLGVTLFDRLPRAVELTQAGRILYRYGRDILRLEKTAEEALREFSGQITGTLEVGGSTIPGEYILPGLLGPFRREAPEVEVCLRVADTRDVTSRVLEGKLEVGMVGGRPETETLESFLFCRDRLVLIVPPDHRLAAPASRSAAVDLKALADEPLWLREPGSGTRQAFVDALSKAGLEPRNLKVIGQLGSSEAVKHAVRSGAGISVVSSLAVAEDVACGRLRALEIRGLDTQRGFWAIRHRQRTPSPAAKFFFDFLRRAAEGLATKGGRGSG